MPALHVPEEMHAPLGNPHYPRYQSHSKALMKGLWVPKWQNPKVWICGCESCLNRLVPLLTVSPSSTEGWVSRKWEFHSFPCDPEIQGGKISVDPRLAAGGTAPSQLWTMPVGTAQISGCFSPSWQLAEDHHFQWQVCFQVFFPGFLSVKHAGALGITAGVCVCGGFSSSGSGWRCTHGSMELIPP